MRKLPSVRILPARKPKPQSLPMTEERPNLEPRKPTAVEYHRRPDGSIFTERRPGFLFASLDRLSPGSAIEGSPEDLRLRKEFGLAER